MKAVKYLGFLLGVVVTLAAALALFVSLTFDAARVKSEVARVVKDQTQRTLEIEGDLELAFWPSIGVQAGRTRLSERGSDKDFVSLDRAHVSLSVLPLLRRELVIDRLELEGVNASVIRRADGSFNFDDLVTKEQKPEQEGGPVRFAVSSISITRAQVVFEDQQARRTVKLADLGLRTGRVGPRADGKMDFSGSIDVDAPRLQAQVQLSGEYRVDLAASSYELSGLAGRVSGDFPSVGRSEVTLAAQLLQSDSKAARVEGLQLSARGKPDGEDASMDVSVPRAELSEGKAASEDVKASLQLRGPARTASIAVTANGLAGNPRQFKVARLAVDADVTRGADKVKGTLTAALASDLDAKKLDLSALAGQFGLDGPMVGGKALSVALNGAVRADLDKRGAAGELAAKFEETNARLKFNAERAQPLVASFDFDADRLNVDRFSGAQPATADSTGAQPAEEKPIDLSPLKGMILTGRVRLGALQVANLKATDVRADLRLRDGRLEVRPMSAALYGGTLAGSLTASAGKNEVAARQALTNVSVNPLLRDLANRDILEGQGNVSIDVTTAGTTVAAMKRGLSGSARMALRDGAIKCINLAKTFRTLKAQVGSGPTQVQQANQTERTDFTELSASFVIRDGVARNNDLSGKSPLLRLGGAGEIDIGAGTMNYLAKASVVATSTGQQGKELAALRGVTIPVRVTGPFEQLSYAIDVGALASEAAKAQAQRAIEQAIEQKAPDQLLKEGLKGLFK